MRYIAAYMLCTMGGNASPSVADIEKVLGSVGIECDKERAKKAIGEFGGKSIDELVSQGESKLATVPVGGGGGASAAGPTAAAAAPAAAKEEKKEAKKEDTESEDDDMGFGLFD